MERANEAGVRPWPWARSLGAAVSLLIVLLVAVAPIPAFLVQPGPLFSLAELVTVDGRPASGSINGDYLFTTIAVTDADTADLVRSWFSADRTVVARSAFIPPGSDEEAFVAEQVAAFEGAVGDAEAAVADLAGLAGVRLEVPAEQVGGPSAGLLIALAAFDDLVEEDLADGRRIGGTGEVADDGTVSGVGSVALKVVSAVEGGVDIFLVPAEQADLAREVADGRLDVIGVHSLADAVAALSTGQ